MTYEQAIEYIHGVYWRGSKLGLTRITELLSRMGNPQDTLRFVHVAGTNGKGSVCAMLSSILCAQGYRTGLYISPYLERFNERIQMNGIPITDDALCEVTAYVRGFAETMADLPTEFEIVCAIAFEYFRRQTCDIVVLEVGLGGRLDATNVIGPPALAVLTPIDFDHMQYLGNSLDAIATEKCGIIKSESAVVSSPQQPKAMTVIEKVCQEKQVPLTIADSSQLLPCCATIDGQQFDYRQFENLHICLLGEHQLQNAALAVEAALQLNARGTPVTEQAIRTGLAQAKWPGRFEVLCRDPLAVFDGAHNPHGARAAVAAARQYLGGRAIVLVGVLQDKDFTAILETVDPVAARYVATQPDNPRALPAQELATALQVFEKPVKAIANPTDAVTHAVEVAKTEGLPLLVLGSLYMAGEIRAYFTHKRQQTI